MDYITINELDTVQVSLKDFHKYARRDITAGEKVIKYGFPIGIATADIKKGEPVHSHNLKTLLDGNTNYTYDPAAAPFPAQSKTIPTVKAYLRKNGDVGIRNDIWVINTVGCINSAAQKIAAENGALSFPHPYGCSQLGGDFERTAQVLANLIKHPNAGGVLVLGLGCENTNTAVIKSRLGAYDEARVRFLNLQECDNEFERAAEIIKELKEITAKDKRVDVPASRLKIGVKCGGSDGLSGISANPLVGRITDRLVSFGGSAAMTEVPEMFGAEQVLLSRCQNRAVFDRAAGLISGFKAYFMQNGCAVSENPSPGNRAGGITTLEEKSLGCVQKGGTAPVTDVITYGGTVQKAGLTLVDGPGNDMVAATNLAAAGCQLVLFTTGRGTPFGSIVPTIKISSNSAIYNKKRGWIDFDGEAALSSAEDAETRLWQLILETAGGKLTKNERNGFREIAIFKSDVTL